MITIKKILVPTDFSEHGVKAVRYGVELATKFGAELHLLHAFEPVSTIMYGDAYVDGGMIFHESVPGIEAAAIKFLDDIEIENDDLNVIRNARQGHAFVEIIRYAKDQDIDLIVIGTHGRGAIAHMLLGSVAEKVVRKAPCPVLVVRDEEHDFVMP